jgi:hypothetical protein
MLLRDGCVQPDPDALRRGTPPGARPPFVPDNPAWDCYIAARGSGDPSKVGDLWRENWKARLPP